MKTLTEEEKVRKRNVLKFSLGYLYCKQFFSFTVRSTLIGMLHMFLRSIFVKVGRLVFTDRKLFVIKDLSLSKNVKHIHLENLRIVYISNF